MTSAEYREARTRDQELKPTQALKIAAKRAGYYAEHKDEIAAKRAGYYAEHKDEIAAKKAAYYAEHKDEIAAKQAAYRAARRKMEVRTCVQ